MGLYDMLTPYPEPMIVPGMFYISDDIKFNMT